MLKRRRWYDKNPYIASLLFMLKDLPDHTRKDVANKIIKYSEKFKESQKDKTVIDTTRTPQILGLYQSTKKRRWYDKDPLLSKAINSIAILSSNHYKTLISQLFPSIHKFYVSTGQGTLKDKLDQYIEIESVKPVKKEIPRSDIFLHEFGFADVAEVTGGQNDFDEAEYEELSHEIAQYAEATPTYLTDAIAEDIEVSVETPAKQPVEDAKEEIVEEEIVEEEIAEEDEAQQSTKKKKIEQRIFSKNFDAIIIKTLDKNKNNDTP